MLRFLTAGESHGQALVVIVEGLPAGLHVSEDQLQEELGRRRLGFGRGPRMRFEQDDLVLVGGIRHGRTLGAPVAIEIRNSEWPKWTEEMSPHAGAPASVLSTPRPGHADLTGMLKYGFDDARDILERASARETAARVVAGALAKALIRELGTTVLSHTLQLGDVVADDAQRPSFDDRARVDENEVRCFDEQSSQRMITAIKAAAKDGDSLGGVSEVLGYNVPVGLGSHVHWDRKVDGLLAQAILSIQAVKAVELGAGYAQAGQRGSEAHDAIFFDEAAHRATGGFSRETTRAGGVEGGMTTGGAPLHTSGDEAFGYVE